MGNSPSNDRNRRRESSASAAAEQAKDAFRKVEQGFREVASKLEDDHPVSQFVDNVCGAGYVEYRPPRRSYSMESDGEGTYTDDDTYTEMDRTRRRRRDDETVGSGSYVTEYTEDDTRRRKGSFDIEYTDDQKRTRLVQPLASSFAKRCYFTKAGIDKTSQHYEGLTLTGNIVLMLASAMKLKGCPTICDEDLRRVEQTYPNQFSRLPDELLLSSGWRRISKYCHFSNKPIPDGIPFFHSKRRLHPSGGYYFLLANSVGMIRPIDVEPLSKDTLVLLETDFPNQCDNTPEILIQDPDQWTLVEKFCFFSGGPINTQEDVYYEADFDGNPIYMLAFLSPTLTPEELYKLNDPDQPGLKSMAAVRDVEAVYDLTERDFDDLKLYHLGPCRALPQYILQPNTWSKLLPPHFMAARGEAISRAQEWQAQDREGAFQEDEVAFASATPGNVSSPSATTLNMDAPDPEDPLASPATMLQGESNFPFDTHTNQEKESATFVEEEKKSSDEADALMQQIEPMKTGEEDFTPIKRAGYKLKENPMSPGNSTASHQSTALRGAQALLQKKRNLRKMEVSQKQAAISLELKLPSPASNGTWEAEMAGSTFSDENDDRNSRRQLILNMAKARIMNSENRISPKVASADSWTENPTFPFVSEQPTVSEEADQTLDFVAELD